MAASRVSAGQAAEQPRSERDPAQRAEGDVGEQAQAADQVELLGDEADADARLAHLVADLALGLHRAAEGGDRTLALIDGLQAVDRAQQGGLARTGRADERDHLASTPRRARRRPAPVATRRSWRRRGSREQGPTSWSGRILNVVSSWEMRSSVWGTDAMDL
jgi:hypothetical protein